MIGRLPRPHQVRRPAPPHSATGSPPFTPGETPSSGIGREAATDPGPYRQAVPMRDKRLVATALVSAVVGAVLALLAPSAFAGSTSDSGSSPSNRGWVADHGSDSSSDRGSGDD